MANKLLSCSLAFPMCFKAIIYTCEHNQMGVPVPAPPLCL